MRRLLPLLLALLPLAGCAVAYAQGTGPAAVDPLAAALSGLGPAGALAALAYAIGRGLRLEVRFIEEDRDRLDRLLRATERLAEARVQAIHGHGDERAPR